MKWIKITTDIFDDEKILMIESLPDAYAIITCWFKLLCLAGKQNNRGVFMLGSIAYTDKMLATVFRMKETTVTMALQVFEQFGMVEIVGGVITLPNWGKHQNLEQMEERRKYQREYQKEYRKKQKHLAAGDAPERKHLHECLYEHSCKHNVNALEEEEEKELELDKRDSKHDNHSLTRAKKDDVSCQQIVDLFNAICISLPSVRSLTNNRTKAIKARLNKFTVDDFKLAFQNAENSEFLKGSNDRSWQATFDWLIKDQNMVKVLEGNYANKSSVRSRQEVVPGWCNARKMGELEMDAIKRMMSDSPGLAYQSEHGGQND